MDYLTLLLRMQERETERAGGISLRSGQTAQMQQMLTVLQKSRRTEQAAVSLRERRAERTQAERGEIEYDFSEQKETRFAGGSMAEISRFFERDARRYGG